MGRKSKAKLGKPVQIRFPGELHAALREIAEKNGIEFVDAARLAIRFGAPILRDRMRAAVKEA
jgi:hypothetical protein